MTDPSPLSALDRLNRRTYAAGPIVRQYAKADGWLDRGEEAALGLAAADVDGRPVLDIGVGGGRTAPLMRAISADYLGVDYSPAMVAACRARFPDARFDIMDARQLRLPDAHFALVAFSFNGLDSVPIADRPRILAEVRRVLRPGGAFVFSALNRDGPLCRTDGVDPAPHPRPHDWRGWLHRFAAWGLGVWHRLRHRSAQHMTADRAVVILPNHAFGVLASFITPAEQARELAASGLLLEAIFTPEGERIAATERRTAPFYFHYVARCPA